MLNIGIQAQPNQECYAVLNDQECTMSFYQRGGRMYMDLTVNDTPVVNGAVCHDKVDIIQNNTDAFLGNLCFVDIEGARSPRWEGIGTRYFLVYLTKEEVEALDS